jgi:hypothetical protein
MGNSSVGRETRRFNIGETVWVSPSVSGQWLCEDEATVVEDLGTGYIVHQASERVSSYGLGHFVCDLELAVLFAEPYTPLPKLEVFRDRRLWEFNAAAKSTLGRSARCARGGVTRRVPAHA